MHVTFTTDVNNTNSIDLHSLKIPYFNRRVRAHTHAHTHARMHTHISNRYTCLAFSKLYSFVKSSIRQNVYREFNTHILSGYRYWSMNKKR